MGSIVCSSWHIDMVFAQGGMDALVKTILRTVSFWC